MPLTPSPRALGRRSSRLAGLALAGAALLTTCSSGPEARYEPAEAATTVSRVLNLTPEQTACVQGRFDDNRSAAAALNPGLAGKEAREKFVEVMRACVPPDAFVGLMTAALQDLFEGGDATQATCLQDALRALAPADLDLFYVYFSNPGGVDVLEVDPITKRIAASCNLTPPGAPRVPGQSGTLPPVISPGTVAG